MLRWRSTPERVIIDEARSRYARAMSDQTDEYQAPAAIGFIRGPLHNRGSSPLPVRIAFWILLAGAAITAAQLVVAAVGVDWHASGSTQGAVIASFIGGAAAIALRIYVSLAILRGYGAARIYLTVVAGVAIIVESSSGFAPIDALVLASVVAPIVLVWVPISRRYFEAMAAARAITPRQPSS